MAEFLTPDICVIGGGAAGLAVARRARAAGATVVLVEPGRLGGNALHAGVTPAAALAAAARRAHHLRTAGPFGVAGAEPQVNARAVFEHVHAVIDAAAPAVTPDQLGALGIELIGAPGRFLDRRTLAAGEQRVRARRYVIATGSRPLVPEIPGLADVAYFTSSTLFDNTRKLTHLVVIGAGAVALELAQACRRLGAEVTVVAPETPLAGRDPELGAIVLRQLADEGISLRVAAEVARVEGRSLGIGVAVRTAAGEETLDASHILVAAGAAPVLEGLALEKAGVRVEGTNGAARLVLGTGLRTSNFRIYAAGDVVDGEGSVHAAARHAAVVVERALFGLPARVAPGTLPAAVFTDPELAETGLTEPELLRRRGDFRVLRVSLGENDRARMERQAHGLVKLVVGRGGRLLGAGIVGAGAAEMISLFSLAIANGLPLGALARFSAPYPTLTEAVRAVAEEGLADEPASPLRRRLLALRRVLP